MAAQMTGRITVSFARAGGTFEELAAVTAKTTAETREFLSHLCGVEMGIRIDDYMAKFAGRSSRGRQRQRHLRRAYFRARRAVYGV